MENGQPRHRGIWSNTDTTTCVLARLQLGTATLRYIIGIIAFRLMVFPGRNRPRLFIFFAFRSFRLLDFIITCSVQALTDISWVYQQSQIHCSLGQISTLQQPIISKNPTTLIPYSTSLPSPPLIFYLKFTFRKTARSGYCDLCICPTFTPSDTIRHSSRVRFALCENLVVVTPDPTARPSWPTLISSVCTIS